jgi:hypothetical protein
LRAERRAHFRAGLRSQAAVLAVGCQHYRLLSLFSFELEPKGSYTCQHN